MRITKKQLREAIRKKLLTEAEVHTVDSLREKINDILTTLRTLSSDFGKENYESSDEEDGGFTPEQGVAFHDFFEDAIESIQPILDQLDDMSG
tara:strand:- start:1534 stop:1812 length:279 start_codon:yes stop_codon:yes gene_type:complete